MAELMEMTDRDGYEPPKEDSAAKPAEDARQRAEQDVSI
jgi:hypothetical protein